MNLFIAIDFNELKDYFVQLQQLLPKNAKLSLTKTFHLTLKFLGELQPEDIIKIKNSLKNIKFNYFQVCLDTIGIFPSENYIKVVWVGLKPENDILELQEKIDEYLKGLFKKEKDFKAHITLARIKYLEDKKSFVEQLKKIKVDNKKVEVNKFELVKSTLSPEGPVYETIEVYES